MSSVCRQVFKVMDVFITFFVSSKLWKKRLSHDCRVIYPDKLVRSATNFAMLGQDHPLAVEVRKD